MSKAVTGVDVIWQDAEVLAVLLALQGGHGEVCMMVVKGDPSDGQQGMLFLLLVVVWVCYTHECTSQQGLYNMTHTHSCTPPHPPTSHTPPTSHIPTHTPQRTAPPTVHTISGMPMGDKQLLLHLSFHPTTRGGAFAVIMADGADQEYLQWATYTNIDQSTQTTVDLMSQGSVHLPTPAAAQWCGGYVHDGSGAVAVVPCKVVENGGEVVGNGGEEARWEVVVMDSYSLEVVHRWDVGGGVVGVAASPNGVLLAVAVQGMGWRVGGWIQRGVVGGAQSHPNTPHATPFPPNTHTHTPL